MGGKGRLGCVGDGLWIWALGVWGFVCRVDIGGDEESGCFSVDGTWVECRVEERRGAEWHGMEWSGDGAGEEVGGGNMFAFGFTFGFSNDSSILSHRANITIDKA